MSPEPLRGLPKTIQTALRDGKTDYAVRLFANDKYADQIRNNSWDLIPVITECLTEENRCRNSELFKCCRHLLTLISEQSNPEEALLQFISEIEEAKDNAKFIVLLEPLYILISRVPANKINSYAWSFNALQTYLDQCVCPSYDDLEGGERLLVDNGEVASNITRLYREVVIFYGKFPFKKTESDLKKVLRKFLVQLLGTPLCYLNMEVYRHLKTDGRELAEEIVQKIFKTSSDPFVLTEMRRCKDNDEVFKPNTLSVANLFYLIWYEGVCFELVPKVYSARYVFETSFHLMSALLESNNLILSEKALKLAVSVLTPLQGHNLSYIMLDSEENVHFCTQLTHTIAYNQEETTRKRALEVFTIYLNCYEVKGTYLIITNLMKTLSHSSLKGYLITFYKDLLSKQFLNENNMSHYFTGVKLKQILKKFCHLPDKEKTDLMEYSDEIIAALNLLRYLILRDKKDSTKFKSFSAKLNEFYLEPLQKALDLSRSHYELEIKNANDDKKEEVEVNVYGRSLSRMDKEEKLRVLGSVLTAFDVMQSLLSRVVELMDQ